MTQDQALQSLPPDAVAQGQSPSPCNLCGSASREPFVREDLVRCKDCGLVFVDSRPDGEQLVKLYDEIYYRSQNSRHLGYTDYLADEANIRRTARKRLRQLQRFVRPPGRLLDVGCATGFFLDEARMAGWQVSGLDLSQFAAGYARRQLELEVFQGTLESAAFPAESFDLVTMWDLIEHVPDPAACLREACSLLCPGGIISLATPDVDSLPARIAGKSWVGYKLSGEHITFFSKGTLTQMLERSGFETLETGHVGKHVTLALFRDRLGMYFPTVAKLLQSAESMARLSSLSLYVNPLDIIQVTARKPSSQP